MAKHSDYQNDDSDFEIINGRKCLKDGRALRVPVTLMDSMQRSVRDANLRVVDAQGGNSGSRPGYRLGVEDGSGSQFDAAAHQRRVSRGEIYQTYDAEISQRWRGEDADDNPPTGAGDHKANYAGRPGDPFTCRGGHPEEVGSFGAPATLVKEKDDELFCRPIRAAGSVIDHRDIRTVEQQIYDHQNNMARIYAEVEADISRAWRQT